eukprot:SAG25_NODE_4936_length_728_cov_0.591415_1_plen_51_part_10
MLFSLGQAKLLPDADPGRGTPTMHTALRSARSEELCAWFATYHYIAHANVL